MIRIRPISILLKLKNNFTDFKQINNDTKEVPVKDMVYKKYVTKHVEKKSAIETHKTI